MLAPEFHAFWLAERDGIMPVVHTYELDPAGWVFLSGRSSSKPVETEFVRRVNAAGVACTVRDTRGQEIAAACGQLAAEG